MQNLEILTKKSPKLKISENLDFQNALYRPIFKNFDFGVCAMENTNSQLSLKEKLIDFFQKKHFFHDSKKKIQKMLIQNKG